MKTKSLGKDMASRMMLESDSVLEEDFDFCVDEVLIDLEQLTREFGAVRLKLSGHLLLEEVVTEDGTELIVTQLDGGIAN